jgi:uncharacterized FlaG/YvyC family protein
LETDAQFDTDRDGKKCIVEFLDNVTGEVLHAEHVTKKEAGKSTYLEALGTEKGLKFLKEELKALGKEIVEVVHDNNTNVDSKISAILPAAKNSKDMWHNTKASAFKDKLETLVASFQKTLDAELQKLSPKGAGFFHLVKNHFY